MVAMLLVMASAFAADSSAIGVLDRFVEVTGGASAYEQLGDMRIEGFYTGSHLRFYGVERLPFETLVVGVVRWKRIWPNSGITETLVSAEGWRHYPDGDGQELRPLSDGEHAFYMRETPFARVDWRSVWDEAVLEPEASIEGEDTQVVRLTAGTLEVRRYFSKESGLLLRSVGKAGDTRIEISYADYKIVDGVRLPHLTTVDIGPGEHHVYHVERIGVRATVDATEFAKPAS